MSGKTDDSRSPSPTTIVAVMLVLAIVGSLVAYVLLRRPQPIGGEGGDSDGPSAQVALTDAEARQLVEMAHVAVGHLENLDLDAADPLLVKISEQLPSDPLGPRNLVVARLLAFDSGKVDRDSVAQALDRLRELQPDVAATPWLAAKVALKASSNLAADPAASAVELRNAATLLQRAAELAPDNDAVRYQLFEAVRTSDDPELQAIGEQALAEAYQLDPENLFTLSEWLLVQAQNQDPTILTTLERARQTIAPMREPILARSRVDVFEFVDQAEQAVRDGQWPLATARMRVVFVNLLRPLDVAQSDKRRLEPHPLEFALRRFSAPFYRQHDLAEPHLAAATEVRMEVFSAERQPPPLENVRDLFIADFDLDGSQDLIVLREGRLEVYRQGDGASEDAAPEDAAEVKADANGDAATARGWSLLTGVDIAAGMRGLLVADLDHDRDHALVHEVVTTTTPEEAAAAGRRADVCFDADVDVVVYGDSGFTVLRNVLDTDNGRRTLVPVSPNDTVSPNDSVSLTDVITGVLVDFDADSNLDLVLSTESGIVPLLSRGDMTFTDVRRFSDLPATDLRFTSLLVLDSDHDVDLDIFAVAPGAGSASFGYLENLRHGNFRWRTFSSEETMPINFARSLAAMYDGATQAWQLAGAGEKGLSLTSLQPAASGTISELPFRQLWDPPLHQVTDWDFDNDGYRDLLTWGPAGFAALHGGPEGTLAAEPNLFESVADERKILAADVADIDLDGDLDVAAVTSDGIRLISNEGGNDNHWLRIRALGQVDNKGKANHNGLGSLIEIKTGPLYQAQVVRRPVTHFGMGQRARADVVRFLWTNGVPQAIVNPSTDEAVCELMVLKGSCPYVYTWTGERFEFFTDLLWASPIGLQFAEHVLAPARPWEYLLVPGNRLRPRDGAYVLQVTEELWEAAYFDSIELIAVDHPADVEVFSNEKVGPAEIAEFQVHSARNLRQPVAARDQHGRDVLSQVQFRDGVFLRGFDRQLVPGLVDEHFLEIDLGQLDDPQQIRLFLTGWIFPTDTSTNVALSRHPQLSGPRPPSIQVPDATGEWHEAVAYMGFPGGKTKTIVVDLSGVFIADDFRLRIVTSNEIYWDRVSFTVDEAPATVKLTPLALTAADLHYRGFSRATPGRHNGPEEYDYSATSRVAKWPPMEGRFTRYGDVRELLTETDDRLLVMGAGDEVTLRFDLPADEPPPGWTRDFLMHNVGWDKDADMHTVTGMAVEPLPFNDMWSYPFPFDQPYPDSPPLQKYLDEYQTRKQSSGAFWGSVRRSRAGG